MLLACEPKLSSWVGRNERGDAASFDAAAPVPADGGVGAPEGGVPGDAGGVTPPDAATLDGGPPDAGLDATADATPFDVRDAQIEDARAPLEAGPRDAASAHSQAWPLADSSVQGRSDAGDGFAVGRDAVIVVDGDIGEWPRANWTELTHRVVFEGAPDGAPELAASCAWHLYDGALFLALVVRDDVHSNQHGGFDIWKGDSVQIAFDVGEGRSPYDWEYGVALADGAVEVHRWLSSDADKSGAVAAAVARWDNLTVYEVRFLPRDLGLTSFEPGTVRTSVAVNENDDDARTTALALVPGIVEAEKSKAAFLSLVW